MFAQMISPGMSIINPMGACRDGTQPYTCHCYSGDIPIVANCDIGFTPYRGQCGGGIVKWSP